MDFTLAGLDHVALTVRDVERSAAWYQEVLGLERIHHGAWDGVPTMVGVGHTAIALFPVDVPDISQLPIVDGLVVKHFAFRASREEFDRARESLPARGISIEFQDHEISHSIYFRDPDGHLLEITTYDV